jgi:hypothetical protein
MEKEKEEKGEKVQERVGKNRPSNKRKTDSYKPPACTLN